MFDQEYTTEMPTNCTIIKAWRGYELRGWIHNYYIDTDTVVICIPSPQQDQTNGRTYFISPSMIIPDEGIEIATSQLVVASEINTKWAAQDGCVAPGQSY